MRIVFSIPQFQGDLPLALIEGTEYAVRLSSPHIPDVPHLHDKCPLPTRGFSEDLDLVACQDGLPAPSPTAEIRCLLDVLQQPLTPSTRSDWCLLHVSQNWRWLGSKESGCLQTFWLAFKPP
jgi:hypothetical protein